VIGKNITYSAGQASNLDDATHGTKILGDDLID